MSGGVDSSVAAFLMKEKGFDCLGITMRLFRGKGDGEACHSCCSDADIDDAAETAFKMGIPFEVVDFSKEFRELIIKKFIRTYEEGAVPNPCIDCNSEMKFGLLLKYALEKGCDHIVTGHYARIDTDSVSGRRILKKSLVPEKDQSYVLYRLTQEELSRVIFPLGDMGKDDTRRIAAEEGFINAKKHDSQDICFVPDGDYVRFMEEYSGKSYPDGDIVDINGRILGRHHGAVRYTNGQRRGLGISSTEPLYVIKKDMEKNRVYVGTEKDLYSDTLYAIDLNWISVPGLSGEMRITARTRYSQKEEPATVYPEKDGMIKLVFDKPQRAVTPGQAVVLYDGDTVVGGGTIAGPDRLPPKAEC